MCRRISSQFIHIQRVVSPAWREFRAPLPITAVLDPAGLFDGKFQCYRGCLGPRRGRKRGWVDRSSGSEERNHAGAQCTKNSFDSGTRPERVTIVGFCAADHWLEHRCPGDKSGYAGQGAVIVLCGNHPVSIVV
jgi:hypothetical protein